jgi:hypothetical protein
MVVAVECALIMAIAVCCCSSWCSDPKMHGLFCCAGGSQPITVAFAGTAKPDISSLASDLESTLTNVPVSVAQRVLLNVVGS